MVLCNVLYKSARHDKGVGDDKYVFIFKRCKARERVCTEVDRGMKIEALHFAFLSLKDFRQRRCQGDSIALSDIIHYTTKNQVCKEGTRKILIKVCTNFEL